MTKQDFLAQLRKRLSGIPQEEAEERTTFYADIIDDRMEDGVSEEDAVHELGSVEEIAEQIIADIPMGKLVKERFSAKRKLRAWETVLLVFGSPLWLSLLLAALSVIVSLVVCLWSVVFAVWATFVALGAGAFACAVGGIAIGFYGNILPGIASVGAGLVCAGLAIYVFFGCKAITKGIAFLTKKSVLCMKNSFVKKEAA